VALTVKGVEVVVEIKNLARGVELWRWGADEQCLGIEGEVATCSAAGERRGGGLAVERHDGCRSTALTGHRVNWGGGGVVRLGARPSGGGGGGASCLCGQVAEEEGGPVGEVLSRMGVPVSSSAVLARAGRRRCHATLSRGVAMVMSGPQAQGRAAGAGKQDRWEGRPWSGSRKRERERQVRPGSIKSNKNYFKFIQT
jgi:hypothetical protein